MFPARHFERFTSYTASLRVDDALTYQVGSRHPGRLERFYHVDRPWRRENEDVVIPTRKGIVNCGTHGYGDVQPTSEALAT